MHIVLLQAYLGSNHAFGAESLCTNKLVKALADTGECRITVVCYPDPIRHAGVEYVEIAPPAETKYGVLWRNLRYGYPGGGVSWAGSVTREVLRINRSHPVDVLHTRSQPLETHLAGLTLSRNLKAAWLAYFSDPVPSPGYEGTRPRDRLIIPLSYRFHAKIVRACDAVGYPSARLIKYVEANQWKGVRPRFSDAFVLPHILPHPPLGASRLFPDKIVLLHCGKFYDQGRHPYRMLHAMASLVARHPDLRHALKFVQIGDRFPGMDALAEELGIQEMVHQGGSVTPAEALEYCNGADALVLIEHETMREGIYFPSKLADYLAMKKPVLALTPEASVVSDLLGKEYPFRADPWDDSGIRMALERLCQRLGVLAADGEILSPDFGNVDVSDLEPATVSARFLRVAQDVRSLKFGGGL